MKNIHGLEIGDKALRLKWREHLGWTWQKFEVTFQEDGNAPIYTNSKIMVYNHHDTSLAKEKKRIPAPDNLKREMFKIGAKGIYEALK